MLEFIRNKYSYLNHLDNMDSLLFIVDSISKLYNKEIPNFKLVEEILIPETMRDTIKDWITNTTIKFRQDLGREINDLIQLLRTV